METRPASTIRRAEDADRALAGPARDLQPEHSCDGHAEAEAEADTP
ncbi:hypothetical protein OHB04_01165 [Streptomyces sp. NBC_01775]|nr:hypothetical protein [Streptomyces sp. NBC_01775]WSB74519.1 hypothetical protein OHB04_01165 [Streptomyces sp. NBC_01775]